MEPETILVVDFGGQTAHLIARRIRQLHVFSKIVVPENVDIDNTVKGIILSGGPHSVYENNAPSIAKSVLDSGIPILGLCYGHQLITHLLGGTVSPGTVREFGKAELEIENEQGLFSGLHKKENVWMSHGDTVENIPPGFDVLGRTSDCSTAAIGNTEKKIFGVQFHPEVSHTENGLQMLENFVVQVCACNQSWTMQSYIKQKTEEIKQQAENKNVFMLVSGGVDSTVGLALISTALGRKRVKGLHVDTGFMRKNESADVMKEISEKQYADMEVIEASREFFTALHEVIDPEEKREIIGNLFITVQKKAFEEMGLNEKEWLLGQGTIYPDTIESAETKHASKIKTHHNRVELIQKMIKQGKVIEPLAELYKDEVRELGKELGIDAHLLNRHPFPGPGLAIRLLCSDGMEENLEEITKKTNELITQTQYSTHTLPIKSVGVQGDFRTYAHPSVITGNMDWHEIEKISTKITNEVKDINRVLFSVFPKKIETVTCIPATLTEERVQTLQTADAIVQEIIEREGLLDKIWQFPVVLLPVSVNGGNETIVLRPISSTEAMTARFFPLSEQIVHKMVEKMLKIEGISAVLYDCTHKPPATIEWE
jgi:GMP synthase (glutamine-hydrolysing)